MYFCFISGANRNSSDTTVVFVGSVVYLSNILCVTLGWDLWNGVSCQEWLSKRITKHLGAQKKLHRRTKCNQVTTLRTSITEWRQLTCTATGVRAEPSTRPAGRGSSGAPPGFDWSSPRSRPKNRNRGGQGRATCYSRGIDVYKLESATPLMWESIFPQVQPWLRPELPAPDPNYSQIQQQQQQLCNTIYRGRGGGIGCRQCSMTGTYPVSRLYVFAPIGQHFFLTVAPIFLHGWGIWRQRSLSLYPCDHMTSWLASHSNVLLTRPHIDINIWQTLLNKRTECICRLLTSWITAVD